MEQQKPTEVTSTKRLPVKVIFLLLGLLGVLNIVLFALTDPLNSPVIIIMAGFVVASANVFVACYLLTGFLTLVVPRFRRYRRRVTVVATATGVVSLAMSSIGQLTWRDEAVILAIVLIGYLYLSRFPLSQIRTANK